MEYKWKYKWIFTLRQLTNHQIRNYFNKMQNLIANILRFSVNILGGKHIN